MSPRGDKALPTGERQFRWLNQPTARFTPTCRVKALGRVGFGVTARCSEGEVLMVTSRTDVLWLRSSASSVLLSGFSQIRRIRRGL